MVYVAIGKRALETWLVSRPFIRYRYEFECMDSNSHMNCYRITSTYVFACYIFFYFGSFDYIEKSLVDIAH